jgi:hypothetical protein
MLILAGGGRGLPLDYGELERWTRVGAASVRLVNRQEVITSVRQAAAACNVTPPVVRRWLSLGLIPEPPWTRQQLHRVRDETDPQGRRGALRCRTAP